MSAYKERGWEFVLEVLNTPSVLENLSGLVEVSFVCFFFLYLVLLSSVDLVLTTVFAPLSSFFSVSIFLAQSRSR